MHIPENVVQSVACESLFCVFILFSSCCQLFFSFLFSSLLHPLLTSIFKLGYLFPECMAFLSALMLARIFVLVVGLGWEDGMTRTMRPEPSRLYISNDKLILRCEFALLLSLAVFFSIWIFFFFFFVFKSELHGINFHWRSAVGLAYCANVSPHSFSSGFIALEKYHLL